MFMIHLQEMAGSMGIMNEDCLSPSLCLYHTDVTKTYWWQAMLIDTESQLSLLSWFQQCLVQPTKVYPPTLRSCVFRAYSQLPLASTPGSTCDWLLSPYSSIFCQLCGMITILVLLSIPLFLIGFWLCEVLMQASPLEVMFSFHISL